MKHNYKKYDTKQNGFSLIEIMVGLVIGLLVTLVISQAMSLFEGQKRSTTGTADAQTNGNIALYNVGRDMQLAGYALTPTVDANSPLECATVTPGAAAIAAGMTVAAGVRNITPIAITNGVSDTIDIRYGDSILGGIPTLISAAPIGKAITVKSNFACRDDDFVIITKGTSCVITKLAATADSPSGLTGTQIVNLKSTETVPGIATANDSNLSCVGNWNMLTYSVSNGNLQLNGTDAITGIVNIQAQYGISASANSNVVTQWVDATAATGFATPTVANRNRIKAIRIAVVARNPKIEPASVNPLPTNTCSSRILPSPTGLCAWAGTAASPAPAIDLSADASWQRYRYRVFETIIPLRNIIWSKDTL
jgi:type IV pilus assembly protein PilW